MYNGKTIEGSKLPLTADHPSNAPQLKVNPRYAWGCKSKFQVPKASLWNHIVLCMKGQRNKTIAHNYSYPECQPLHEGIREDQKQG